MKGSLSMHEVRAIVVKAKNALSTLETRDCQKNGV